MYVGCEPAGAASTCFGRSIPVSTSAEGMPARLAPRMSVSSRSPRKSGCCASKRATASSKIGTSGLPATVARRPTRCARRRRACRFPGRFPVPAGSSSRCSWRSRGCRPPPPAAARAIRGFGEMGPADLGSESLHDGRRRVVCAAGHDVAGLLDFARRGRHRPRPARSNRERCARQQPHRRLRAGDDVGRCGLQPQTPTGAPATEASVRDALFVMYPSRRPSRLRLRLSIAYGSAPAPA